MQGAWFGPRVLVDATYKSCRWSCAPFDVLYALFNFGVKLSFVRPVLA
jgi:hypothetical protein